MATIQTPNGLETADTIVNTDVMEIYQPASGGTRRNKQVPISRFLDEVIDATSDTAWTSTTTLLNSWTGTVRYIKRAGVVYIEINNLDGSASTATTVLSLPAGYRPAVDSKAIFANAGATSRASVSTAGSLVVGDITAATITGQISYPVL